MPRAHAFLKPSQRAAVHEYKRANREKRRWLTPGPGAYDPARPGPSQFALDKADSVFKSKTPQHAGERAKGDGPNHHGMAYEPNAGLMRNMASAAASTFALHGRRGTFAFGTSATGRLDFSGGMGADSPGPAAYAHGARS